MHKRWLAFVVVCLLLVGSYIATAQVARPYRNGSVWQVASIRVKPGMDNLYLTYLANDWKREQEALKSAGLILSYKVLQTEPHNPADFTLLLMTEYKDLATMEANESKADAIAQKVTGDDQKQVQGYKDRAEIREVLGVRLAREIVLEPRR